MSMEIIEQQPCVGLFGTCGYTTFRQDLFIPEYERRGIPYFNPQVKDWRPELAAIEADHARFDVVQCWPVTGDSYGIGSLAETGYSIANSLRSESPLPKYIITMIEKELDDSLVNEAAREESLRARRLASAHLEKSSSPNLFVVDSLDEMLETSITLQEHAVAQVGLMLKLNPAYKTHLENARQREEDAETLKRMTSLATSLEPR